MATAFGMTHALPNVMDAMMKRQGDQMVPHVDTGGMHATAAGMVSLPFATTAYLPGGGYLDQEPAAIDYTARGVAATGYAWVCLHASRSAAVAGWSRQPGTHYLVAPGLTRPALPANAILLMFVTTASGALHEVGDRRHLSGILAPRVVDVRDYGAVEGGVVDCTAALNAATHGFETWHDDLRCTILIPPGLWLIDGTVYVRNGQTLTGMGMGASKITTTYFEADGTTPLPGSMFVVGSGLVQGVEAPDVNYGGIPPEVCYLHINPGRDGGIIRTTTAGFILHDLFCTNIGTGLLLGGADGLLSNIYLDQGSRGIVLEGINGVHATNIVMYLCNYGLVIRSEVCNIHLGPMTIQFSRYAHLLLDTDAANVRSVHVSNVGFVTNEQFATLVAQVLVQSATAEVWFHACHFSNMKGYAVRWGQQFGTVLHFDACVFDGKPIHPLYATSTDAGGILTGAMTVSLRDCTFRDLVQSAVLVGTTPATPYETHVTWDGGMVSHTIATYVPVLISNSNPASTVVLRDIDATGLTLYNAQNAVEVINSRLRHWVGPVTAGSGRLYWSVPYRTGDVFQVTIGAMTQSGGSADYRKTVTAVVDLSNGWNGTQEIHTLALTVLHRSFAGNLVVPDVDLQVAFESGGTQLLLHRGSGSFAVSVPDSYTHVRLTVDQVGAW